MKYYEIDIGQLFRVQFSYCNAPKFRCLKKKIIKKNIDKVTNNIFFFSLCKFVQFQVEQIFFVLEIKKIVIGRNTFLIKKKKEI